jgi:hypothetical protein
MKNEKFRLGFILAFISFALGGLLNLYMQTDVLPTIIFIGIGISFGVFSKGQGVQKFKNSVKSITYGLVFLIVGIIVYSALFPSNEPEAHSVFYNLYIFSIYIFSPLFVGLICCSMFYIFVLTPFIEGLTNHKL